MEKLLSLSTSGWPSSSTLVPVSSHAKARSTQIHFYSMYLIKMKIGLTNGLQCLWPPWVHPKVAKKNRNCLCITRQVTKSGICPRPKQVVHSDCHHKFLGKPWEFFPTLKYVSSWFHSSNLLLGFWPVKKKDWISGLISILKISCLAQPLLW